MRRLLMSSSFLRFGIVGTFGFLVDVAILYAGILGFGLQPLTARIPAFLGAATFNWAMNRSFTFGPSGKHPLAEWLSFLVTNSVGAVVNLGTYTGIILAAAPTPWLPAAATAAGSIAGLAFNYWVSRNFVFKRSA
jgi:putative flippase GtrA